VVASTGCQPPTNTGGPLWVTGRAHSTDWGMPSSRAARTMPTRTRRVSAIVTIRVGTVVRATSATVVMRGNGLAWLAPTVAPVTSGKPRLAGVPESGFEHETDHEADEKEKSERSSPDHPRPPPVPRTQARRWDLTAS